VPLPCAFLFVMVAGIAGKIYQVHACPRSGLSVLIGLVIACGAVGALVMFGLGVRLGHARRLFPTSSMPAIPGQAAIVLAEGNASEHSEALQD
jgi:hypothetical protein